MPPHQSGGIVFGGKMKKIFPLNKVNSLLQSGPVILVSTFYKGRNNFMPVSWHTMLDFDPPLIGVVIGSDSFTHKALLETKEAVINIPTVKIAKQSLFAGKVSGYKTDKFLKTGLTSVEASQVKAPLIDECYACIECKVHDSKMSKKYDFFVLKAVKAHCDLSVREPKTIHHVTGNIFIKAGKRISL